MKYANLFLLIILQLIESAVGSCRLRATARTVEGIKQGNVIEQVHQTQLQLQCDNGNCPVTNFTTCDTYTDLNISPDCTDETCSRLYNLCENRCISEGQELPTTPVGPPINPVPYSSPIARESANTLHRPVLFTVDNFATTRQNSCPTTSIIIPTTTRITTTITLIITITTWTPCPQSTIELDVTQGLPQNKSYDLIKPTISALSHVYLPCTPSPPHPTTPPDKTNTPTTSPALEAGPGFKPSACTPAYGASSSNARSALGALLGLSLVLLTLVTAGWVWTCWTMNKKREYNITSQHISNTDLATINAHDVSLDSNPAYETQTPLQRNIAYEDTALHTDIPQRPNTQEQAYEIIPPAASANSISEQMLRSTEGGEEYDRLNRELLNTQQLITPCNN